jgi:hypothetical protein
MTRPRYQDVAARDIPEVVDDDGTRVRAIVGDFWEGPVEGVAADPLPRRVGAPAGENIPSNDRVMYSSVFAGQGRSRRLAPQAVQNELTGSRDRETGNRSLVLFDRGDEITVQAGDGDQVPARLGQTARRAGRVVRADRDEPRTSCARRMRNCATGRSSSRGEATVSYRVGGVWFALA